MKRVIASAALAAASSFASAQLAAHRCQLVVDPQERAACLNEAFPGVSPAPVTPPTESGLGQGGRNNDRFHSLYLHNSATVTDFGQLDLGDEGAQFSTTRSGGTTRTSVDLGAVLVMPALNAYGWQPFAYTAWSMDNSSDSKSDKRIIGLGVQGALNLGKPTGPQRDNLFIYTTANLAKRTDIHDTDDAYQFGVKLDFVKLDWAEPLPGTLGFMPHVGIVLERRNAGGGAMTDGNWSSLYSGSKFSYKLPVAGLEGLGLTALVRLFRDVSAPGGNDRRHARFGRLKATYDLYENKNAIVKPSLFLSRQAGYDPLSGASKAKTEFGLQLTIN